MELYQSRGIVFKTIKYGESSIICDIYTREKGLKSFIVSGIRSQKTGGRASIYRHLNVVDIIAYNPEGDRLARIKEISLGHHFVQINSNIIVSAVAIFMLEICRNSIREREPNPELFDFLLSWIHFLDSHQPFHPATHLLFMIEFSAALGFGPMDNLHISRPYFSLMEGCFDHFAASAPHVLDEEESQDLYSLLGASRETLNTFRMPKIKRDKLTENLLLYYKLHLPSFKTIQSLDVLKTVL
jgi:DNA repair protein RecO (recombination protein O)